MTGTVFPFAQSPRALISGGAGGIGLGIARRLRDVGGEVVLADLPQALEALEPADREMFTTVPMDVSDSGSVAAGVARAAGVLGALDTLVCSAGIFRLDRLEDVSDEDWERTISVNLTGTFLLLREAMPHLKASGCGRVVAIASDAGKSGYPSLSAYCASKFGVVGLVQSVAIEVAPSGVRVNAVCPSTVADTAMGEAVAELRVAAGQVADRAQLDRARTARFPLGRVGNVADVTEAAMFLLSDAAAWITGESLNIDGGSLAG